MKISTKSFIGIVLVSGLFLTHHVVAGDNLVEIPKAVDVPVKQGNEATKAPQKLAVVDSTASPAQAEAGATTSDSKPVVAADNNSQKLVPVKVVVPASVDEKDDKELVKTSETKNQGDRSSSLPQNSDSSQLGAPSFRMDAVALQAGLATDFQAAPAWSKNFTIKSRPDFLNPSGKKIESDNKALVTIPGPPLKDEKPLVAVSPFLQWIQNNPQAAATAKEQASAYQPIHPSDDSGSGSSETSTPYWIPPSVPVTSPTSTDVSTGSSAATYERPVR